MTAPEWGSPRATTSALALHGNISDNDLVTYNPDDDEVFPLMKITINEEGYFLNPVNEDTSRSDHAPGNRQQPAAGTGDRKSRAHDARLLSGRQKRRKYPHRARLAMALRGVFFIADGRRR